MYTIKSKVIATGVIALTLLAAAPVFADSDKGNDGLRIGAFAKILHEEREAERNDRKEDRKDDRKNHATSTSATSTKQFNISGTITFVSGSTLTLQGSRGAVYTINAASASVVGHEGATLSLSALAVNDKVAVKGSLLNNVVIATRIKDKSDATGKPVKPAKSIRSVSAGIITAINGATVSLTNFGSTGSSNVTTNTATKYFVKGGATSSAALTTGSHVLILGTTTATSSGAVNASIIVILTEGLNWLRHFWR